ncbi:hypothetical protein ACRTDU_03900 [Sunxiuqinia elliptica]
MKKNSLLLLVLLLIVASGITYGIIWLMNKSKSSGTGINSDTAGDDLQTDHTPTGQSGSYQSWIDKIGHASFPLKQGSLGVEVLKMQEEMNWQVAQKNWDVDPISEDGIWGINTQNRFKLLYPGYNQVDEGMFAMFFGQLPG